MERYSWTDFLVCPEDLYGLALDETSLTCPGCHRRYEIRDGIAILLPDYEDDVHRRYFANYERIAKEDLSEPIEGRRDVRHTEFLQFVGRTEGKRVLIDYV